MTSYIALCCIFLYPQHHLCTIISSELHRIKLSSFLMLRFPFELRLLTSPVLKMNPILCREGRKKQNCKCVRYSVNGECRVFLVATRDIAKGERLYYDYNGYEHEYPTHHFVWDIIQMLLSNNPILHKWDVILDPNRSFSFAIFSKLTHCFCGATILLKLAIGYSL
jgi:hypothetical protein